MKRMGIEGIYLGGWATSAKGSISEDPGPDLASYPLSQVPDEAAGLVRALLTADRNQQYLRLRMSEEQRRGPRRSTTGRSSSPTPTPATAATRTSATWSNGSSRRACRGTTSRISGRAPRSVVTRAARFWCLRTNRSSASTPPASNSTSCGCRASSSRAPTPRRPTCSTAAPTSATSRSCWAPRTSRSRRTSPVSWRWCGASTRRVSRSSTVTCSTPCPTANTPPPMHGLSVTASWT